MICLFQLLASDVYAPSILKKRRRAQHVGQKMQPTKLPKCGFTLSQAFIITGEEVEETVVGCYSEHMIESTRGSSYSVKKYY